MIFLKELIEAGKVTPVVDRTFPWPRRPRPFDTSKEAKRIQRSHPSGTEFAGEAATETGFDTDTA